MGNLKIFIFIYFYSFEKYIDMPVPIRIHTHAEWAMQSFHVLAYSPNVCSMALRPGEG